MLRIKISPIPTIFPMIAPAIPMQNPSMTNMFRIVPGFVPMAAMVPISRIRS
ncbi:MAG: hypothetical protein ACD_87C00284G0001 [uncultured bacterium]|nr:MAG: hypothetical protein ACD_87C00284G0001 [uncultured bacterium]